MSALQRIKEIEDEVGRHCSWSGHVRDGHKPASWASSQFRL